jgi:glycosyltransferase involved in cell wall biosynthesis
MGVVEQAYLAAAAFDPKRAEPLYALGALYQSRFDSSRARALFAEASQVARPQSDRLFIDEPIYDYKIGVDLAVACHRAGDFAQAINLSNRLLDRSLPAEVVLRVIGNRRYSLEARFPRPPAAARTRRVRVLVVSDRAGSETDSCLDSLTCQELQRFDVTIVRNGQFEDTQTDAFLLDHEQFSLVRREQAADFETCIGEAVAELCQPDEIVVALHAWDRLPSPDTLSNWCALFNNSACELAYGQFLWPSGVLGNAEPACDAEDFDRRGAALAGRSPLAFSARLVLGQSRSDLTRQGLFCRAGYHGTRFVDEVMTFLDEVATDKGLESDAAAAAPRASHEMAARDDAPLISCLMVTHGRLALAKRAIQCFSRQTYPVKELVIVTDDDAQYQGALERYIHDAGLNNTVRVQRVPGARRPLGQLRNISIDRARGDVLCQWDDDDCYHPERLAVQARHMVDNGARACLLTDHLQYLEADRVLNWIDWTLGGRSWRDQLLPGTVMFCRDVRCRYPEEGPYCRQGEDSWFLDQLCDTVPVAALVGMGHLYVYTYHGRNTFSEQHHKNLRNFSLSAHELRKRERLIKQAIGVQPIAKPLRVFGCDGVAFAVHGREGQF